MIGGVDEVHEVSAALSPFDRAHERRDDDAWLAQRWSDPRTRVLHVADGQVDARGEPPEIVLDPPYPTEAGRVLLGVDDAAVAYFAVLGERPVALGAPGPSPQRAGLRQLGPQLASRDAALVMQAIGLANWHEAHPRCSRCGTPTVLASAGYVRRCPDDGTDHHPRTDPAVIMLVTDDAGRALLGRHARWSVRLFSTLAGFVEPGESAEQAVAREVFEEAAVVVDRVTFFGSQPWPFPSSLMLGFRAHAVGSEPVADGTEIAEALWFTRERIAAEFAAGELMLPPRFSIARRLIEDWYGAQLGA